MNSHKRRLAIALALGGALMLAACSPNTLNAPNNDNNSSALGTNGNAPTGAGEAHQWIPGALEEYTLRIWGGGQNETQAEVQARLDREHREREEMIVACMAEQGFQYFPDLNNSGTVIFMDDQDGPAWGSQEFAEIYGFGIANDPWRNVENENAAPPEPVEWVDPNADLRATMSEAEEQAWQEALWGPPIEWVDGQDWDAMQAGCANQVQAYFWGNDNDQFRGISEEVNNFWMTVESDPRWSQLNQAWATCFANSGYPGHASPSEASNSMQAEWSQVQAWDLQGEIFGNWDWDAYPDGPAPQDLPQPDPQEVAAFTEREIAMAVASYNCQQEVNFNQMQNQIQNDLQAQFVEQHRDELEAWAAYEEARRANR